MEKKFFLNNADVLVGRGEGHYWGGEGEGQPVGCETGSRMCCATRGRQPIFCNHCKVTFKTCT